MSGSVSGSARAGSAAGATNPGARQEPEPATYEWRISWLMWPHDWPGPRPIDRVTRDEQDAREQYDGLLAMLADHKLRPCDHHVWQVKLERRAVRDDGWERAE